MTRKEERRDIYAGGPRTGFTWDALVFCLDLSVERQWPTGVLAPGWSGAPQVFKVLDCRTNREQCPWGDLIGLTADSFSLLPRSVSGRQLLLACNPLFALATRVKAPFSEDLRLQSLGSIPYHHLLVHWAQSPSLSLIPSSRQFLLFFAT